jgi:hypothetical protein
MKRKYQKEGRVTFVVVTPSRRIIQNHYSNVKEALKKFPGSFYCEFTSYADAVQFSEGKNANEKLLKFIWKYMPISSSLFRHHFIN